jgi:hypothetical protein
MMCIADVTAYTPDLWFVVGFVVGFVVLHFVTPEGERGEGGR